MLEVLRDMSAAGLPAGRATHVEQVVDEELDKEVHQTSKLS